MLNENNDGAGECLYIKLGALKEKLQDSCLSSVMLQHVLCPCCRQPGEILGNCLQVDFIQKVNIV